MSNVPSYPKNPLLLHPEGLGAPLAVLPEAAPINTKRGTPASSSSYESDGSADLGKVDRSPFSKLRAVVDQAPLATVLLAAGAGLLAGVLARSVTRNESL